MQRLRVFAIVAFLAPMVLGLAAESVRGQCGNYVIMLDERGEPIVAPSHAMPDVERFPLAELVERSAVPVHPIEVPCDGIQCRDDHASMGSPPPPIERRGEGAPQVGHVSSVSLDDDLRSGRFCLSEVRPCAGHPNSLLRPPEVQ